MGVIFYYARRYDQAIEQLGKALELDPNFIQAHEFLGQVYVQKSLYTESTAEFEKVLVISPTNTRTLSLLGYSYAMAGRRAEAQKALDQLDVLSEHQYVPAVVRATIYVGLGQKDKALGWLGRAKERLSPFIAVEPFFDPLRSDPRFKDLLRRMNLQP